MINKSKTPYTKRTQTRGPYLMDILKDVARHYEIPCADIMNSNAGKRVRLGRGLYCYVAYKLTNATLKEIGALIGVRHDVVIFHRDKIQFWIDKGDPEFIDEWFYFLKGTEIWGKNEKIR